MVTALTKRTGIINSRLLATLVLGFSSGLPVALTASTIQAWFTEAGVSLLTVGALTLVGIPYVWKFLWAPLMDKVRFPFWGRRKGWILLTQLCLCFTIFALAQLDPQVNGMQMGVLTLLLAFFSASQDIAVDAYRTEILLPAERGLGSAYYIFAYRMAMIVSGALALIFADKFGWQATYQNIAFILAGFMFFTYFSPRTPDLVDASLSFGSSIIEPFLNFWRREKIVLLLLFVMTYKIGDALALSLMSNFLLHGLGFSLTEIGIAYKTNSLIATILGAFLGGLLLTRRSLYFCLLVFGIMQALSTLLFAGLALVGKNYMFMAASIFVENFCSGMSTAAFMAFLMSLCQRQYTATQYALLSAIASLGRVFLGPVASVMVLRIGWVDFYLWSFVLSFPGLFFLLLMRNRVTYYATLAEQH